jgi:hypothetical protein
MRLFLTKRHVGASYGGRKTRFVTFAPNEQEIILRGEDDRAWWFTTEEARRIGNHILKMADRLEAKQ